MKTDISYREPEILKRGYVTHALTNAEGTIFGMVADCYINIWKGEKPPFYWSEVYVEPRRMATILRKGQLLVNPTDEDLSEYHRVSKFNLGAYEHTYVVFYNDGVNEPSVLGTFVNMNAATQFTTEYAYDHGLVDREHGCSDEVFSSAKVARCEIYVDGIRVIGEYDEAELVEPAYTTAYFYAD